MLQECHLNSRISVGHAHTKPATILKDIVSTTQLNFSNLSLLSAIEIVRQVPWIPLVDGAVPGYEKLKEILRNLVTPG